MKHPVCIYICMHVYMRVYVCVWIYIYIPLHKDLPLGTKHPIYRTGVPLLPKVRFLYILSTNTLFNYF